MIYVLAFLVGCALAAVVVIRAWRKDQQHEAVRLHMLEACAEVALAQFMARGCRRQLERRSAELAEWESGAA